MDRKRIDEIRTRCETATRGPWSHKREYIYSLRENGQRDMSVGECTTWNEMAYENATFIANARQDVPDLLDALEEAQAESKRPRGDREGWSTEVLADVAAVEEKHDIELVSIAFCEQLNDNFQSERKEKLQLQRENERLLEAFSKAERLARIGVDPDFLTTTEYKIVCIACEQNVEDGHKDDCAFKILESKND
jgi:hypothetical protein